MHKGVPVSKETKLYIYAEKTKKQSIIEGGAELLNLKSTITEIERVCKITFYKEFANSSFAKGVKAKKNLQGWLLQE